MKKAFTLLEVSICIVIISIVLASILISRNLIMSAKVNQIQRDLRDIDILINVFHNQFDCIPGDCLISKLPATIYSKVPSRCFNLLDDYITQASMPSITTGFDTQEIDSSAKRTCAFYELQALEPQAFGGANQSIASKFTSMNIAHAIGQGGALTFTEAIKNDPSIQNSPGVIAYNNNLAQINSLQASYNANISSINASFSAVQRMVDWGYNYLSLGHVYCSYINVSQMVTISSLYDPRVTMCFSWAQCYNPSGCSGCTGYCFLNDRNTQVNNINTKTSENVSIINQINTITGGLSVTEYTNTITDIYLAAYLSLSIPGATNPITSALGTSAMYDLRTFGYTNQPSSGFYPYEETVNINDSSFNKLKGNIFLIIRSAINKNDILITEDIGNIAPNIARKLDIKYDDGKPYTGKIVAGKNYSKMGNVGNCTNIALASWNSTLTNLNADYVNSYKESDGCVVAILTGLLLIK